VEMNSRRRRRRIARYQQRCEGAPATRCGAVALRVMEAVAERQRSELAG
jgi:hypothetical protein